MRSHLGVPVAPDDQDPSVPELRGHEPQQQQRRLIGGVQVIEEQHERLGRRGAPQVGGDRFEDPEAGAFGGDGGRGGQIRKQLVKLRDDRRQLGAAASHLRSQQRGLRIAHVRAQRLYPGPVGRCAARLPAPADEDAAAALPRARRELLGEPALADPGLTADEDQRAGARERCLQRGQQLRHLPLAADEPSRGCRCLRRTLRFEGDILGEDGPFQLLEVPTRLDPELIDEHAPGVAIGLQCLRLTPRSVQREHVRPPQPLAIRMLGDQAFQLTGERDVMTQFQVGCDAVLERRRVQVVQGADLGLRELLVGQIGERRPTPQRQRLAKTLRGDSRLPSVEGRSTACDPVLEALEVELARRHAQLVAGGARHEETTVLPGGKLGLERPAQPRDRHLECLRAALQPLFIPELRDQPVARDHLVGMQQQERQQCPLLRSAEGESPVIVVDLERPEYPEVHGLPPGRR